MKNLPCLCSLLFAALSLSRGAGADATPEFSTAGFYGVPDSPRRVFNFNPGWRLLKADATGAEKVSYDDASWQPVNLPCGVEILGENGSGMRNYQGPAWYRKRFKLPAAMRGQQIVLYFEAVMGKAKVWVNGVQVAEHFGGYLPFAVELSALLHFDGHDNVVAVRADNSDDPTYPPGKPQGLLDFTYSGGIYRDVYLIQTGPVHVTLPELSPTVAGGGVFVATKDASGSSAQLEVRTEIANQGTSLRHLTLRTVLEDRQAREVTRLEESADVPAGASQQWSQTISATNVHLWHPDDPYPHYHSHRGARTGQAAGQPAHPFWHSAIRDARPARPIRQPPAPRP